MPTSTGLRRRDIGFLAALGNITIKQLLWPEGTVAIVIGGGGGALLVAYGTAAERQSAVGDGLLVMGVLLGIVFAAFSLLISLMSDDYIRLLDKAEGGIVVFIRPYMLAIGVQITTILFSIAYRAASSHLPRNLEGAGFVIWGLLFTFALADVVALARNMAQHGLHRARLVTQREEVDAAESAIRSLLDRKKEEGASS